VLARYEPHIAILDERSVRSVSLLRRLRSAHPGTGIVILARPPARSYHLDLAGEGATWLSKRASVAEIMATVYLVATGGRCVSTNGESQRGRGTLDHGAQLLTQREREVLACLEESHTDPEIAQILQIGVSTARTHTASIRRKLGVRNRRALIRNDG
jgi:DNA-binding NarL/FixJ family response regulator